MPVQFSVARQDSHFPEANVLGMGAMYQHRLVITEMDWWTHSFQLARKPRGPPRPLSLVERVKFSLGFRPPWP